MISQFILFASIAWLYGIYKVSKDPLDCSNSLSYADRFLNTTIKIKVLLINIDEQHKFFESVFFRMKYFLEWKRLTSTLNHINNCFIFLGQQKKASWMLAMVIYNIIALGALILAYIIFAASFFIRMPPLFNFTGDSHAWIVLVVLLPITGLLIGSIGAHLQNTWIQNDFFFFCSDSMVFFCSFLLKFQLC